MTSRAAIERFLDLEHVAFVGVSRDPEQFPNAVYRRLRAGGRTLYPVNTSAAGAPIEGDPSYASVTDVPAAVRGVLVMVPAAAAAGVVRDAIARGIDHVWLHRGAGTGSVSDEAVALCREHGVDVVDGACPLMFDEPVGFGHRVHRALVHRRFAA